MSTAEHETHSTMKVGFPQPKFAKGDKVWAARETESSETLSCPDCLGSRVWKVTTPAGTELEAACIRCTGGSGYDKVPSLRRSTWQPYTTQLTIGSIRIDTNDAEHPITYMCNETGVGSGQIWYERLLHGSEQEAQVDAQAMATKRILEAEPLPERINQLRISHIQIKDAAVDMLESSLWGAWYSYRRLREGIEEKLCGECRESCSWELEWEDTHRDPQPFQRVLKAANATALKYGDEELTAALAALPFNVPTANGEQPSPND